MSYGNEKWKMKKVVILLLMLAMVSLTGCHGDVAGNRADVQKSGMEKTEEITYVFADDLGREVSVDSPVRVAALLGSYADIWYLAGGEICASADDAWEDFGLPLPETAVNLGMTKELSLEKLFQADPDFVLASSNTKGNVEWMDTLEAAEIPVAYFEVSDFEDYLRVLKICTEITGREDLYEQNGLAVQEQIEQVIGKSKERLERLAGDAAGTGSTMSGAAGNTGSEERAAYAPKVLSLRASATFIRAKNSQNNVLGEMLKSLGCVNIADNKESLLENLSMEHIMLEDPDYIFFIQQGDNAEGTQANIESFIKDNPASAELTAVKEGRVYLLEKELYALKPNDRWGEAYGKLEAVLAGEAELAGDSVMVIE